MESYAEAKSVMRDKAANTQPFLPQKREKRLEREEKWRRRESTRVRFPPTAQPGYRATSRSVQPLALTKRSDDDAAAFGLGPFDHVFIVLLDSDDGAGQEIVRG